MKYTCILRDGSRRETWTGEITLLRGGPGWYKYGNYLCIPNHDVGCELSDFSDILWNEQRISGLMRKVDAVTVATGLACLQALAGGCLKS